MGRREGVVESAVRKSDEVDEKIPRILRGIFFIAIFYLYRHLLLFTHSLLKHPLIYSAFPLYKFFLLEPECNFAFASFGFV